MRLALSQESLFAIKKKTASDMSHARRQMARLEMSDKFRSSYFSQHVVRIDNSTFERVEEFKYLGTTLTNQNSILEETMSRWRSGNACYLSVQNLLSSRLLSKNLKNKI
jgi:UDP-galactopyranose mutase